METGLAIVGGVMVIGSAYVTPDSVLETRRSEKHRQSQRNEIAGQVNSLISDLSKIAVKDIKQFFN